MMNTRKKLTAQDWLALALDTLDSHGIHKVNVEYLARELGVTKGSFYWHFKNRDALLKAMLQYWVENLTTNVIDRSTEHSEDAKDSLFTLITIVTDENMGRYEAAIRAWATHNQIAQSILQQVDKQRITYIQSLFKKMGFDKADAEIRARLLLYYQVSETGIFLNDSKAKRKKLLKQRFDLLTRK